MRIIVTITVVLVVTGLIMIYSATAIYAGDKFDDQYYFLKRQLVWSFVGLMALLFTSLIPLDSLENLGKPMVVLVWMMLVMVFLPGLGREAGGASRWLRLGGFSFQPAEAAKLAMIVYIASFLSRKKEVIEDFRKAVVPPVLVTGITMGLIVMQPDFGTCVLIGIVIAALMLIAGVRIKHLAWICLGVMPALWLLIVKEKYRLQRILVFLDPWKDPGDAGYQVTQSFIGFGSGGVCGRGWGNSIQKLYYLPESYTDFIFSVIGEEKGFIGAVAVLGLFAGFVYVAMRISQRAESDFGYLAGMGVAILIGLQSVIHMGVVTGCFPTKGLPLPFVSFGGSSLVVSLAAVGLLINVARHPVARRREAERRGQV